MGSFLCFRRYDISREYDRGVSCLVLGEFSFNTSGEIDIRETGWRSRVSLPLGGHV